MKLDARNQDGSLVRGFDGAWRTEEGDEVTFEATSIHPATCTLSGARLQPVDVRRHHSEIVTTWCVPIHTWAGRAEIEFDDGETQATALLDVAPHPKKLGIDAFREMLIELAALSRNLPWGLSSGALRAAEGRDSPPVVHPAVLEHELPALRSALTQLCRDPLLATRRTREVKSIRHARYVDAQSLRWLAAHPRTRLAIRAAATSRTDEASLQVEQRRTAVTVDHPATAAVRFRLEQVLRLLHRNAAQLAARRGQSDLEERDHAAWLAAKLGRAAEAVRAAMARRPISEVASRPASEGAVQALVDHPVYARVYRIAGRLLDPGVAISENAVLRASARRTHELYELLVLYRLIDAVVRFLGSAWSWTRTDVVPRGVLEGLPADAAFIGRGPDGRRVEVRYQSTFGAYQSEDLSKGKRSLSKERRPDVTVGIFWGDALRHWFLVDAKYSASRMSIHDALADIHVYRDSLRWNGERAAASFIAVPACAPDAAAYASAAYHDEHFFGAIVTSDTERWRVPTSLVRTGLRAP